MNYIKYKDQTRINLDNVFTYNVGYNDTVQNVYKIWFTPACGETEEGNIETWTFETKEERDRTLALIDKAAKNYELTVNNSDFSILCNTLGEAKLKVQEIYEQIITGGIEE